MEALHIWEFEELACHILGLDYDEIDADTSIIEEKLYEEFEVSLENFSLIVSKLMPLIVIGESPLTKKSYKGFADEKNSIWFNKIEI